VDALRALDRALELEPGNTWAMASFAAALLAKERYDEALDELDEVLERDPAYAFAMGTRGEIKATLAEWKGAIADLSRSIELDASSAWFNGVLGWAYENDEQPAAALEAYTAAAKLDDTSLFWRRGRAEALHALRRPDAAAEFKGVINEWRSKPDPQTEELSVVGWSYYRLGKHDKAVRAYTDGMALSSDREPTQFDLALALAAGGREPLAISEYERAVELARRKHQRRQRALVMVARRDVSNAIRLLDEEAAERTLRTEQQAAQKALAAGMRVLETALEEAPADAPALAST
jgi:tetratricopeptide (TPR) repeat protein